MTRFIGMLQFDGQTSLGNTWPACAWLLSQRPTVFDVSSSVHLSLSPLSQRLARSWHMLPMARPQVCVLAQRVTR